MNFFKNIINYLNDVYKKDDYIRALSNAAAVFFEKLNSLLDEFKGNFFFDSLNLDGAKWWESLLKLNTDETKDLDVRGAQIQTKWQVKSGHTRLNTLQNIVDKFFPNGGKITFPEDKFLLNLGVENLSNTRALIESLDEVKPAHIILEAQALEEKTTGIHTGAYVVIERAIELLPEHGENLIWDDFYGNFSTGTWADEQNTEDNDGYWSF